MTAAGRYDTRIEVQRLGVEADDGFGNVTGDWSPLLTRWAGYRPQFGREAVAAGRLEATRVGTVTMRRDSGTIGITADDRLRFKTGPNKDAVAQIRSIIPLVDEIQMTIEIGVAS